MSGSWVRLIAGFWLAIAVVAAGPAVALAQESDDELVELLAQASASIEAEFELMRALSGPLEPDVRADLSAQVVLVDTEGAELEAIAVTEISPTPPEPSSESNDLTMVLVSVAAIAIGLGGAWALRQRDGVRDNLMLLAMTDGLTSLANRRRLDLDLDHHIGFDTPVTVAMIDIDRFKNLNDRHGHVFGDAVIRDVAATIDKNVRTEDVVYRYGGEEFCVLLPGASKQQAFDVIDRVRQAISKLDYSEVAEAVTVSAGISMGPGHLVRSSLRTADDALLQAKEAGRDRVIVSGEPARV